MKWTGFFPSGIPDNAWEYRCEKCGQMRLSLLDEKPKECKNCGSEQIKVAKPGELEE